MYFKKIHKKNPEYLKKFKNEKKILKKNLFFSKI